MTTLLIGLRQYYEKEKTSVLSGFAWFSILLLSISCRGMKNHYCAIPKENEGGSYITVNDGLKIFVYEFIPGSEFKNTIYVVPGITCTND
jgi:hypothetical protein